MSLNGSTEVLVGLGVCAFGFPEVGIFLIRGGLTSIAGGIWEAFFGPDESYPCVQ
jgi:hypothetical protein